MSAASVARAGTGSRAVGSRGRVVSPRVELVRSGAGHAAGANLLGLVAVVALVIVGWVTVEDPASTWRGAAVVGGATWLVSHFVDLALGLPVAEGGTGPLPLTLTPLGTAGLVLGLHVRSGRRLARLAEHWAADRAATALAVVAGAAVTAASGALVATYASGTAVAVTPLAAGAGCAGTATAAVVTGMISVSGRRALDALPGPVGAHLARCLSASGVTLAAWLLGGSLALTAMMIIRIAGLFEAGSGVAAGALGGLALLGAQLTLLPNAVVWTAGLMSGSQLTVDAATISLQGSAIPAWPPLPIFAAAPGPGPWPLWALLGIVAVIASGAVGGWHAQRGRRGRPWTPSSVLERLADAAAIGVVCGAGAAAVCWAASGAVAGWGPIGFDPLTVGAAIAVQTASGAALSGLVLHLATGGATPERAQRLRALRGRTRSPRAQ